MRGKSNSLKLLEVLYQSRVEILIVGCREKFKLESAILPYFEPNLDSLTGKLTL